MAADVRLIAFYLPQFHPIPENDTWWGAGFTEWTNVRRGRPMYTGHRQPRRPGALGYYDLRLPEVRRRQAELARTYGVHGFCYYYYWFSGRRLLERPLDLMLAERGDDFPFCVCWANENWSRRWDGSEHEILMEQQHRPEDPRRFIEDLAPVLRDPRYIRVNGAPLLLVYRPPIIPDLSRAVDVWRRTAEVVGIGPLHLCAVQSFGYRSGIEDGFDAMVEFPAHASGAAEITDTLPDVVPEFSGKIFSYPDLVRRSLGRNAGIRRAVFGGVIAGWDNTARRGYASHIYHDATPEHYEPWLRSVLDDTRRRHQGDHRLVFVNAWNEWGEGAYLEPDEDFGYGLLEATARAVFAVPPPADSTALHQPADAGESPSSGAVSEELAARFEPLDESGVIVPETLLSEGVAGFLDALNARSPSGSVTVNRSYDVLIMGWVASSGIEVDVHSTLLLLLSSVEAGARYVAQVRSRMRRDDVVAHLAGQPGFHEAAAACALYSGFRAYLNIAAVAPGLYVLEAVVPRPDGHAGARFPLHAAVTVR